MFRAVDYEYVFDCPTVQAEQYVRQTRRTLMLDGLSDKCECTITDNDDGEIQFSCVLSQEGIVCRNYRSMLDIVSIGSIQHLDDDDPIGIYYTIEGFKDGQIARIRKGNTFSRVKYQLSLVTPEDQKMVLSLPNNSHSPNSPLPLLKQSLVVHREWGNILKIRTKTSNFPIATIQKEMNSMRYWLHLEPNVDSCFVSAIAAYILRKKIFGDKLPKVLKTQNSFARRARRLSISFRRRKKPRPLRENLGGTAATSSTL